MGKPKAPTPPDPRQVAGAQTAQNIGTAIAQGGLNNVNQVTPWGNLSWSQSGTQKWTDPNTGKVHKIPNYTATTSLSRAGQKMLGFGNKAGINFAKLGANLSGRLGDILGKPLDAGGLPDSQKAANRYLNRDYGRQRTRVEEALLSRVEPGFERDMEGLRSQLIGQGITEGSEAWDRAMGRLGEQRNDARFQAVLAGGTEQSRLAGLARDQATFAGQNRDRALSEMLTLRSAPVNEVTALMSGGQVQGPSFVPTNPAQIANVDRAGLEMANYGQRMQAWQQQMANRGNLFGGLLGLGSGALMGGYF